PCRRGRGRLGSRSQVSSARRRPGRALAALPPWSPPDRHPRQRRGPAAAHSVRDRWCGGDRRHWSVTSSTFLPAVGGRRATSPVVHFFCCSIGAAGVASNTINALASL